jgi:hypothetical protein
MLDDMDRVLFTASDEPEHSHDTRCFLGIAHRLAKMTGRPVRIIRFDTREVIEVIMPGEVRVNH